MLLTQMFQKRCLCYNNNCVGYQALVRLGKCFRRHAVCEPGRWSGLVDRVFIHSRTFATVSGPRRLCMTVSPRMAASPHVVVCPSVAGQPAGRLLMDEQLRICVEGLERGEDITVHAGLRDETKVFESCGTFRAGPQGIVDLSLQPSLAGSYTGVAPMGLFWSMVQAPGQKEGLRLMKKNVHKEPFVTQLDVYNGHLSSNDIRYGRPVPLASTRVERWYMAPDVTRIEVRAGRLRGTFFKPSGAGQFPVVVDMFGSGGGLFEYRASLLASRGIAALALAYFGHDDLPKGPMKYEIELEYFFEAVDWLLAQDGVGGGGVGLVAASKGGDIALMVGAYNPKVRAIVNINGTSFNSLFGLRHQGSPLIPVPMDFGRTIIEDGASRFSEIFNYTKDDLIPVWNHGAKVLSVICEDDCCNPRDSNLLLQQHYPADQRHNLYVLTYPGAGHLLEPPYTPLCSRSYHKHYGMMFQWGGSPPTHAAAQEDVWPKILCFIKESLA